MGRTMFSAYCYRGNSKKNRFNKQQEAKGLLRNLELTTLLSNVSSLANVFFHKHVQPLIIFLKKIVMHSSEYLDYH